MSRVLTIFLFVLTSVACFSQAGDTLYINYVNDPPFATIENNKQAGIEIDIINEYVAWLKTTKKMNVALKYNSFTAFDLFYSTTKSANKNTMGLGAITITPERIKEVDFTNAFLKNVSFCITNGNAPDIKTKTQAEIVKTLGSMTAFTIPNSNLSRYVAEIKKTYITDLKVNNQTDQIKILDEIAKSVLNFGFVDAIEFWFYLKNNPTKFLKMQKPLNQSKEELGFIMPKGSQHKALFNEFFSGPAGFKSSKSYRTILEKYVGSYMTQNMAVN